MDVLKGAFGETAKTLDTAVQTDHLLRMQTLKQILLKVMRITIWTPSSS